MPDGVIFCFITCSFDRYIKKKGRLPVDEEEKNNTDKRLTNKINGIIKHTLIKRFIFEESFD
jgi:hypothetical protein